jgi:hypothetical protein
MFLDMGEFAPERERVDTWLPATKNGSTKRDGEQALSSKDLREVTAAVKPAMGEALGVSQRAPLRCCGLAS